ncbi:MAG: ABC transporter permease [Planctomycetota bacterium]
MANLPLANILRHKLRSVLSALGIGIGICMLVTLSGLARGSLYEVADRWEAVDAELIVYPRIWGDNVTTLSGVGLPDRRITQLPRTHDAQVAAATCAFLWRMELAGQDQLAVGVDSDPTAWKRLTGGREPARGRWCEGEVAADGRTASQWLVDTLLSEAPSASGADELSDWPTTRRVLSAQAIHDELRRRGGFELVIDARLAEAGGYRVGQIVEAANHRWQIVGIVPAGGLARVFMPRRVAQFVFGSGDIRKSTVGFIKLRDGVDPAETAALLTDATRQAVQVRQYRQMLEQKFGVMFRYVDMVNSLALLIAFLFIMVTLYTMVLQRTRDIAILKACGATSGFILRQVMGEACLLTMAGLVAGVGLSFLAAWAIGTLHPLLTVTITWSWLAVAAGVAGLGAVTSAMYPAWRATRVDVAAALTLE